MLTYTILQFVQHLEAVQVEFRHDDLPAAFARTTIKLPTDGGAYPAGAALDELIRAHAPDREWFEEQEARLTASTPELATLPPELAACVPAELVIRPTQWHQTTRTGNPVIRDGQWIRPIEVVDLPSDTPIEDLRALLLAEISRVRYEAETRGVQLGGAVIKTDRESQSTVTSAWAVAKANPDTVIDWKAEGSWVQVDAATMVAIGDAVFAHVQGCFSHERVLAEAAEAATTLAELKAIDIHGGW